MTASIRPIGRRALLAAAALPPLAAALPRAGFAQAARPKLTVAVADLPPGLEPARDMGNVGTRISYTLYDTLIRRDFLSMPGGGGSKLEPGLAASWKRESPSELVVTLREGVRFHNGDRLHADDVAFTFSAERMWGEKPMIPDARNYFGVLTHVEALDDKTVRFRTRGPDVLLEMRLASWASWIVNKRHYQAVGIDGFARNPVGTGPMKFRSFTRDTTVQFEAFDEYWMGRPNFSAVEFRKVPEVATRVAGLVAGEFDIVTNLPPDQIATLNRFPNVEARSVVLANAHLLVFDMRDPVMADKRVRQALGLAIDRKLLVETLWNGQAVVPPSHNYPEYGPMFLEGRALAFDPERARRLLREAGYRGQKITYRTMPNYYTNALAAAEILVEMWKAVGINAELQVVESFTQMQGPGQQIGNTSNSTRLPDPLGAIWPSWGPNTSFQVRGMWAKDSAAAFNAAGSALEVESDPARRKALFARMLDEWETEAPSTILYLPLETYGVRKPLKWQPYSFFYMDLRAYNLSFG
jgi:peptide/nickel transport system substrate-binding protein